MLDIKFIRQNPEKVKEGIAKKQAKCDIDRLLEVDKKRRETLQALEDMRAQKNKASKDIQAAKDKEGKEVIILKMRELDENSDRLTGSLKESEEEFMKLMRQIPNLPLEEVPEGKDDRENVVLREEGNKSDFDFEPKDYMEIAPALDLIDTERASKVSGSRFGYIKGEAAMLELALVNLAFDTLIKEKFTPVFPPVMLKPEMMDGMGYVERGGEEIYYLERDKLYLVGTSEQSIGAMHADEVFEEKDLPKRYAGFSTCFRREAGAYGKDTKGILRVHQFDKVEMFSFCHPEKSKEEHKLLLKMEEKLMQLLKIPYHVLQICSGDLGDPAAAKYDIEAWMPGQGQYRETHSTSNCTDYQARRLNIKYRAKNGLEFVHTLNGTAFAIGRMLIAIIENYQQKDGSILVPEALQKYTGFKKIWRQS
jgi:seryl-tRNA synthetase